MWNVGRGLGSTSDVIISKEVTFVEVLCRNQQVEEVPYEELKEDMKKRYPIFSNLFKPKRY